MARIVKTPDERRRELIACAQKLFYSKGYESTSVRDIVKAVGVAKGTFYYYFDSKSAILEAMVDELIAQQIAILHGIVADETLTAIPKWIKAFQVINKWKIEHKAEIIELLRLMHKDENVLLQHKTRKQVIQLMAPEFAKIITQGVEEGVFETPFVEDSAQITLAIMNTFSETFTDLVLHSEHYDNALTLAQRKLAAMQTAIERVLGATEGSLPLIDMQMLDAWFVD